MAKNRFTFVSAVHLILMKDGKILLLRRANTGYEDGNYSVVAGHIDQGEGAKFAMCREAQEEAGITISENDLELAHVMLRLKFKDPNEERIDFFFVAKKWEGEVKNMEPEKCDDLSWFDMENLPKNIIPYVYSGIANFKQGNIFSEFEEQ